MLVNPANEYSSLNNPTTSKTSSLHGANEHSFLGELIKYIILLVTPAIEQDSINEVTLGEFISLEVIKSNEINVSNVPSMYKYLNLGSVGQQCIANSLYMSPFSKYYSYYTINMHPSYRPKN